MSVAYNPLSGNFETKEPGPQGPAGTVSAAGDGSQGTPSISFASDTTTGLYKYGPQSIAVSTGGTGKLFIDSNGRVGIGASTPGDLVEVKTGLDRSLLIRGNRTSLPVDLFAGNPAAGYGLRDMSFSANSITFGTGSSGGTTASPHMHLTSTGRLGLGTSFPGSAFHVNSTNNFTIAGTVQTNAANSYISFVDSGTTAGNVRCGSQGNDFVVNAGGIRGMRIKSNGRVGIGNENPGEKLTIGGEDNPTLRIHTAENGDNWNTGSQYGKLQFYSSDYEYNSGGEMASISVGVNNTFGQTASIRFSTTTARSAGAVPTERMRLQGSALLLGGTLPASPNISLNANGSATFASGVTGDYFTTDTTSGFFNFYRNQGSTSALNTAWGTTGGAQNIKFFNDGSASFAGGSAAIDSNGRYEATSGNSSITIGESGFISLERDAANENAYLFRGAHKMGGSSIDNRFVVWGDGSTGIGGTLNATSFAGSSPNITLKADGSGTFAGNVGIGATDTLTNKLFVDGGNVRIDGAPSTDAKLEIRGDNSTSSSTDAVLSFVSYLNNNSGGSNADIRVTNAGGSYGEMIFSTRRGSGANTEAMRLTSTGSAEFAGVVSMGDSAAAGSHKLFVKNSANTTTDITYYSELLSGSNNVNASHFYGITQGVAVYRLTGNGTSTFTSDERKKKNIETTRDGYLEDLRDLRVVKYNWISQDDDAPKELGLIAQEVEQVFPGLVMEDVQMEGDDYKLKTLKGSVLPFMLLKALQEAAEKIESLEAKVAALEAN